MKKSECLAIQVKGDDTVVGARIGSHHRAEAILPFIMVRLHAPNIIVLRQDSTDGWACGPGKVG